MTTDPPRIEMRNVGARSGAASLLDDVNFDIEPGSTSVILGQNGSGKTSLLRVLGGAISYTGSINVAGYELHKMSRRRRSKLFAFMEQHPLFPPMMSVEFYVALGASDRSADSHRRVENLLQWFELDALRSRRVDTLSGGEKRRAALAQTLAQHAPIVLLDEPTTGLDVTQTQSFLALLQHCPVFELGATTIVIAIHDLTLASHIATHAALVDNGTVLRAGNASDVMCVDTLSTHFGADLVATHHDDRPIISPRYRTSDADTPAKHPLQRWHHHTT